MLEEKQAHNALLRERGGGGVVPSDPLPYSKNMPSSQIQTWG